MEQKKFEYNETSMSGFDENTMNMGVGMNMNSCCNPNPCCNQTMMCDPIQECPQERVCHRYICYEVPQD